MKKPRRGRVHGGHVKYLYSFCTFLYRFGLTVQPNNPHGRSDKSRNSLGFFYAFWLDNATSGKPLDNHSPCGVSIACLCMMLCGLSNDAVDKLCHMDFGGVL